MKIVPILGVKFAKISLSKTVEKIKIMVEKGGRHQVMTLNPEYLVRIQEDQPLKQVVDRVDLVVADGTGIILASWLIWLKKRLSFLYYPLKSSKILYRLSFKNRITGGELVEALAKLVAQEGWKIGLIGGEERVVGKALDQLRQIAKQDNHSTIQPFNHSLKGFADSGPENVRKQTKEGSRRIKQLLLKERPQILFTAFGFYGPIWIEKTLKALRSRGKSLVAIEVGGVFNYLARTSSRPPEILRKIGLEWLWRLITEPWRIKRQLKLLKFVKLLFLESPKAT